MLSLETARKLKDVGLKWEPQKGDQIFNPYYGEPEISTCPPPKAPNYIIWIPRLGQLLAEIEKQGWKWSIVPSRNRYRLILTTVKQFVADSPDEAAAAALIWILEQEGKPNEF